MDVLSFLLKYLLPIMLTAIITFFLSEPVRLYYGYFIHVIRNARRLSEHMKHLEGRMKDLQHGGNAAKVWVNEMNSLKEDVDNFEHDYKRWESASDLLSRWGRARYRIAMRGGDLLERVDLLDKKNVDTGRLPPLPRVQERDASNTVLGLESALNEALTYLELQSTASPPTHLDVAVPGPRVIGIYGVGGVGKTTLLKKINNFFASSPAGNVFDHVIWAMVSKDVDHEKIQKDVARGLGLSLDQNQSVQQRAEVIFNYMKDKSFLILLDDLWAHLDLEELGIPNPQEGGSQLQRRVVFTTRSQNVCDSMQAMDAKKERIKVAVLSDAHAWQLFRRMLGDKFNDSNSEIYNLAMGIVKECRGLPLALKVIGAAMSSRKYLNDWEDALELLKESQPISGMEKDVIPLLKHSFDYLNDDKMRKCFLCCALWPEDVNINKNELIKCWMGLGLLDGPRVNDRYRAGRTNIQILKDACLLEAGNDEDQEVKMHDVVRDMALQIASDKHKWMVRAGVHLKEVPRDVEQWAAVECMSLMHCSLKNISLFERDQGFVEGALPKLSTLILHNTEYPVEKIPNIFFPCMRNLTYLDLSVSSFSSLKELPPEICVLTELRYLNLTYMLGITSLPQEFGQLEKLRYLFLKYTYNLKKVTPGVMPRALEVLELEGSSLNWEVEGETIFRGLKKLQVLKGITVRSSSQLRLLSELSYVQIWGLNMVSGGMEEVDGLAFLDIKQSFESDHLRNHLQYLAIRGLGNLTELKVDFGVEDCPGMVWNLRKLEVLDLSTLPQLEKIVWRGVEPIDFLPRLRKLCIIDCCKLKNVSWVLQLRCLEYLQVHYCKGMTTLIDENEIGEDAIDLAFPHLKELHLKALPQLEGIFHGGLPFPSLEIIYVKDCPKLRRLSFCSPMTNSKMREIKGTKEWWDGLQWEDEHIRTFLYTHFVDIWSRS